MDYWEKKLSYLEMARRALGREVNSMHMHNDGLTVNLENNDVWASNTVKVSSEDLIKGLDDCKGTPPEQLRALFHSKVDEVIKNIEDTLGWPSVIKMVNNFELQVRLTGNKDSHEDVLEIDLSIPDDYSPIDIPNNMRSHYDPAAYDNYPFGITFGVEST